MVVKSILQKDPTAISYIDMNGTTLLMIAVESVQSAIQKGHGIEIVKLLADHGVNVFDAFIRLIAIGLFFGQEWI